MKLNKKIKFLGVVAVLTLLLMGWRFFQKPAEEIITAKTVVEKNQDIAVQGGSSDASINANIDQSQKLDNDNLQEEIIEKRTENGKAYKIGQNKFALDVSIGAVHYKDNYADPNEQWKDIDLTWEGDKITKAPYELTREGDKITVRDKKTGNISTIELLDIKPAGLKKEIVPENTMVSFRHTLPNDNVPFESKFRVTGNIPLETRAFDDDGELSLETTLEDGMLTERLNGAVDKKTGKARPVKGNIRIDPTLDLQVGASANDGYSASDGTFGTFNNTTSAGYSSSKTYNSFHRFINITMSGTINVAYITWRRFGYVGTPSFTIAAEDAATPTAPTSRANHMGRARTTATTAYSPADPGVDNWSTDNPNVVSVIQELVNSYTYDGDDPVQIFLDDAAGTGSNYIQPYAWDYTGNLSGLKLHIEYTPPSTVNFEGVDMEGIDVN